MVLAESRKGDRRGNAEPHALRPNIFCNFYDTVHRVIIILLLGSTKRDGLITQSWNFFIVT